MLLASRYELFDIPDVEALCVRAARTWTTKTEARLSPHDFESLTAFLIAAVWRMSRTYDPARCSSFKAVVVGRLGNRCVDWLRTHRGRTRWQFGSHTYERELPRPVSLDQADEHHPLAESLGRTDPALDAIGGGPLDELVRDREAEAVFDVALVRALARRLTCEHTQRARAA